VQQGPKLENSCFTAKLWLGTLVSVLWSKEEVHRPIDIGFCWLTNSHGYAFAVGGLLSFLVGDLESCVAPKSLNVPFVCRPSLLVGLPYNPSADAPRQRTTARR
ncbi:hypothetical protein SAMN02745225_02386, partial [Ferrithrix thermotolerans DSM 19514]